MAVVDMINHPSIMACKQHTRPEIIYLTHSIMQLIFWQRRSSFLLKIFEDNKPNKHLDNRSEQNECRNLR